MNGLQPPGLILVIDLSASLYITLLDRDEKLLASRIREQGTRGEAAHELLDECLAEAGANPVDLGSICIGTGPGSFTGIRVGVAMAQGLGFAGRLPLYPYSSLAAMSLSGRAANTPGVIAAIAANAGQYFVRAGIPPMESLVAGDALRGLANTQCHLITSGRAPDRDQFQGLFAGLTRMEEVADFPSIAKMARSHPPIRDGIIRPNYLQASAAEEKRRSPGSRESH